MNPNRRTVALRVMGERLKRIKERMNEQGDNFKISDKKEGKGELGPHLEVQTEQKNGNNFCFCLQCKRYDRELR